MVMELNYTSLWDLPFFKDKSHVYCDQEIKLLKGQKISLLIYALVPDSL